MNYSYIKNGAIVRWNDPAIEDFEPKDREEQLNLKWEVFGVKEPITDGYDIVNIKSESGGEAEVYACELRYSQEEVKRLVTEQIINMMDNDILRDNGIEEFVGWCENGEVFDYDKDCIELMHKVADFVDNLTYNFLANW